MKEFTSGKVPPEKPSDSPEKIPGKPMLLLINGKVETHDFNTYKERYGLSNWVRIPNDEFDDFDAKANGELLDHFNLGEPNHVPGEKYLVMRIVRNGDRAKDEPPVLSLDGAFIVQCEGITNNVYDQLTAEHFRHSVKGISDTESLSAVIQKRYGVGPGEIANRGIAHTLFRVIERLDK